MAAPPDEFWPRGGGRVRNGVAEMANFMIYARSRIFWQGGFNCARDWTKMPPYETKIAGRSLNKFR